MSPLETDLSISLSINIPLKNDMNRSIQRYISEKVFDVK